MILKELRLKNFGKFSEKSIFFCDGINVIYGGNEAGKTTLYTAIGALLFGLERKRGRASLSDAYTTYQPWENRTWYEGGMKFETGGKIFCLERNFYQGERTSRLICETDGEELSVEQGDLEMLLGEIDPELFFNTAAVGQRSIKPREIIYEYLKNYMAGVQEAGEQTPDVKGALEILSKKKRLLEQEQRKKIQETQQQIRDLDSKVELVLAEIEACKVQLERLELEREHENPEKLQAGRGFWARLLLWIKRIVCFKKLRKEAEMKRQRTLKREEKSIVLQELLGEKESLKEELELQKDHFYKKLQEQSREEALRAIELAMERIRQLSLLRKEEILKELTDKASEVLRCITKGKYEKLFLGEREEVAVWDGKRKLKLFQVSTGCGDQVYLSLRIALQDLFFREDTLPLLFDDAFVCFDEERLERLLGYLKGLDRQILIFSCHKREMQLLERQGIPYGKILL